MYKIALCYNAKKKLNEKAKMLIGYKEGHLGMDFDIKGFKDVKKMLFAIRKRNYIPDLVLMDTRLLKKAPFKAVGELRIQGLGKNISENDLSQMLDKLLADIDEEREQYVLFKSDGKIRRAEVHKIVYIRLWKKDQIMYLADGTQLKIHMTAAELAKRLSAFPEIIRIGNGYIFNMKHIEHLSRRTLHMDNGKKIHLSKGFYQYMREQYLDYYCDSADTYENFAGGMNSAINTVLSTYVNKCGEKGIDIDTDIKIGKSNRITDDDLIKIFTQMFENAVNSSMEAQGKRRMEIYARQKGTKLVMVCKNTCASNILFKGGLPKNSRRRGIVVRNILNLAAQYNSDVDFFVSEGIFTCRIILDNKKKKEKV